MFGPRTPDAAVMERLLEEAAPDPDGGWTETSVDARDTRFEDVSCWLCEPGGALLSAGLLQTWAADASCRVLVVALDWPGQIVLRCLVGDVREVTIELEGGTCLPARVEEMRFDPLLGRTCELHLVSVCCEASVNGCIDGRPEEEDTYA